jgi:RNA polymerase sigma factor (sigma-70 family)
MHEDLLTDLVARARTGDQEAWDALVERFAPLIWSIARRYELSHVEAEDVGQVVWLRLVDQLEKIREPAALPGWLATTTQRECSRLARTRSRLSVGAQVPDFEDILDERTEPVDHDLLVAERDAALREAFARLPLARQRLLTLLMADPPVPYAEISDRLGVAIGCIGPYRRRSIDMLRRDPAIAALINARNQA